MAMESLRAERAEALVGEAKAILQARGLTREAVARVADALQRLAMERALWSATDFPPPEEHERQARYLIRQDPDRGYALYLNVMRPGKRIPPHNHTTWACIAAVEGREHNYIYERLDDGARQGHASLRETGEMHVEPGQPIALLPDDIHAVEIKGDGLIRHLHFYGRALETLDERMTFDLATGTCRRMPIGVQTRQIGGIRTDA